MQGYMVHFSLKFDFWACEAYTWGWSFDLNQYENLLKGVRGEACVAVSCSGFQLENQQIINEIFVT